MQGNVAMVTDVVPKFSTGKDVTDYAAAFDTLSLPISNGEMKLTLGDSPVFIEVVPASGTP
jgi:hypothetical protein